MKLTALLVPAFVTAVIATAIPITLEEQSTELEARAEMTYVQNWFIAGGAGLAGVAALASAIASIISASSSSNTCVLVQETIEETKRSEEGNGTDTTYARNATAMIEELVNHGFETNMTAWTLDPSTGIMYHEGIMMSDESAVSNITITNTQVSAHISPLNTTSDSTGLESRTTILTDRVYIEYHATGRCYTTHTKAEILVGVYAALYSTSYYSRLAACWALSWSGPWYGHLKFIDEYTGGTVSTTAYDKACSGTT
jgi:hypothetical protein